MAVSPSPASPVIILTAGFGEGHNSAARGVAKAIAEESSGAIQPPVIDLFQEALPRFGAFMKWGYLFLTTHLPKAWSLLYKHADRSNPRRLGWDWFGAMHRKLSSHLAHHRPAAILTTYPLYSYLLPDARTGLAPGRAYTVVTDSITINSIWLKASVDRYFVTDEFSARKLADFGIPLEKVETSGFAVSPLFENLQPRPFAAAANGFRVLYFATASAKDVRQTLESLLRELPPGVHLTVVMGRHEQRLGGVVRALAGQHPQRSVDLFGWRGDIPQLLISHDLIISKGGGATLHECLAAGTPVVINYVIPGQEEGNAELLERRGCGWHIKETSALGKRVSTLISSDAWAKAKENALENRKSDGARQIARRVLQDIRNSTHKS